MVPPSPPSPPSSRENRSRCSRSSSPASLPVLLGGVEHRRRAAGPGLALAPVRADARRGRRSSSMPVGVGVAARAAVSAACCSCELAQLVAEDHPVLGAARSRRSTTSGIVPRRSSVRSIAITGVMPLPPTRNSIFAGGGSGSTKSPVGRGQPHDGARLETARPGASDRKPSGIARTVIVMVPPVAARGDGAQRVRAPVELARRPARRCRRTGRAGGRSDQPQPGPDHQRRGVVGLRDRPPRCGRAARARSRAG